MAEEKKEEKREKKYAYGPGEQSNLSRAFRGTFLETWLASEYGQRTVEDRPESESKPSKS